MSRKSEEEAAIAARPSPDSVLKDRYGVKDPVQFRALCKGDLFYFARHGLGNEALDPYFHGAMARMFEHGESKLCPVGDFYFPTRSALMKGMDEGWEPYKILEGCDGRPSLWNTLALDKRLQLAPTAMDGSFRGMFIRIVPPEKREITVLLVPRGHLKTTFGSVIYNIWILARAPQETVLIVMNSRENARNVITEMKGFFERDERFQALFPHIIPEFLKAGAKARRQVDMRWQAERFEIPRGGEGSAGDFKSFREASVTVHGIGGRTTSLHASRLHFDDLVDEKTILTSEAVARNIQQFQAYDALGIGEATSRVYIGTPWHYGDCSQHVLNPKLGGYANSCVLIATVTGTDGMCLYPKGEKTSRGSHPGWTPKRVKQAENRSLRTGLFSSQYHMQPVSSSQQAFRPENYKFYTEIPSELAGITVMTVDPAVSERTQGDYAAFCVVTLMHNGHWYVREIVRQRSMGVPGIVETTYSLWQSYRSLGPRDHIMAIGVEANSLQKTFLHVFQTEWRVGGREELPIIPVRASNVASKEFNIKRMAPVQQNGRIWLPAPLPDRPLVMQEQRMALPEGIAALISEGERFPLGQTDDVIDCMSMMIDLPYYPEPPVPPVEKTRVECERERYARRHLVGYVDEILGGDW